MSSGKKGKKKKCRTVDLMSFLADGGGTASVPLKPTSWADDVEDEGFSMRSNKEPVILPTAPRAARGPGIDEENIPANPPFVAYISNLPYDVDEDDLAEFFADMKISNMRLPKDSNKLRGYGYVEFEDRQSLIDALSMTNTTIKTRRVRIEVSTSSDDRRGGSRMGRENRRDMYDDPERTSGDWRSGPRDDAGTGSTDDSYRSRYDNRDRRNERDSSDYDNKPGAWRDRDSNDRGRSVFGDRSGSGAGTGGGGFRDEERSDREWSRYDRGSSRDRDGDRSRSGAFGPRRNYGGESEWERRPPKGSSLESKPTEQRTRPKLQLQPRTKPVEPIAVREDAASEPPASVAGGNSGNDGSSAEGSTTTAPAAAPPPPPPPPGAVTSVPSANIFGAARPVDTASKEREIEERLARSYAESRSKEDGESERRSAKDGQWGRRNGEGEKDKERQTWRSEEDSSGGRMRRPIERAAPRSQPAANASTRTFSEQQGGGNSVGESRGGASAPRATTAVVSQAAKGAATTNDMRRTLSDRERKEKEKDRDDISRMPKARVEQAPPNFVASNKYSMLPDDEDPDNISDD